MIISPDPEKEDKEKDLDLWELTKETVRWLEQHLGKDGIPRDIPFIAAEHNDHGNLLPDGTPRRHIHALMLIQRKGREMLITEETIAAMMEATKAEVVLQQAARIFVEQQEQEAATREQQTSVVEHVSQVAPSPVPMRRWEARVRPLDLGSPCWACGFGGIYGLPRELSECPACQAPLTKEKAQDRKLEVEVSR
jgi:hypothetical protein